MKQRCDHCRELSSAEHHMIVMCPSCYEQLQVVYNALMKVLGVASKGAGQHRCDPKAGCNCHAKPVAVDESAQENRGGGEGRYVQDASLRFLSHADSSLRVRQSARRSFVRVFRVQDGESVERRVAQ